MVLPRPLLATVLCALALPASASATFPGTNGDIVYDSLGSIESSPFAGGSRLTLSKGGTDYAPAVSPDGSKVAWQINRDIWVMDADGSDRHQVTTDSAFNSDPAWSPDGKRIAYSGGGKTGNADIYVISVKGGAATQVTNTPDHAELQPAFSPDATTIAYTRTGCEISNGGGSCVYVSPAAGGAPVNLTPENEIAECPNQPGYHFNGSSREPSWSPDGARIAFTGPPVCDNTIGSDIWVMAATGGGKTDLLRDQNTNDQQPSFSPDGTQIAFMSDRANKTGTAIFRIGSTAPGAVAPVTTGDDDANPDWGAAPKQCDVPGLAKRKLAAATAALKLKGCRLGKVTKKASKARKGTVVGQGKKAGQRLPLNAKVDLTVAK